MWGGSSSYQKQILMHLMSMAAMGGWSSELKDKLEGIDVQEEYTLIIKKKSRLSRRIREEIEWQFEKAVSDGMKEALRNQLGYEYKKHRMEFINEML